jgi:D-arabinose 1-dehydrogenase-like Zn-dependent alcohol dehydrogenase
MQSVQVSEAKGPFEIVERDIPAPGPIQVRIKVQACGICHSDSMMKEGLFPGLTYPRVPGHEVAGVVDEVGKDVVEWKAGQRVGVGWHGGQCGHCEPCRRGEFFACRYGQITGFTYDGGYADYMIASSNALALIPDQLSAAEAAPLMCAGVTTFNALRNSGAHVGDVVAVLGIGGLGHLGVQFAAKMGFRTIAIARGKDKEEMARKLGATHYLDSQSQNVAEELAKMGGARVILGTVPSAKAMSAVLGGLSPNGKLMLLGASAEPLQVPIPQFISARQSVMGWYSGSSIDSQDTLSFSALSGIRSMNEIFPLDHAEEAYNLMISGNVRFRSVLTT